MPDPERREFLDDLPADLQHRVQKVLAAGALRRRADRAGSVKEEKKPLRTDDLDVFRIEKL